MSEQLITAIVTVVTGIIGVAILSVLVSKNANTTGVIQAAASGLGNTLSVAISPVSNSGGMLTPTLTYPNSSVSA